MPRKHSHCGAFKPLLATQETPGSNILLRFKIEKVISPETVLESSARSQLT
jgi:hypothetical protein